MGSVHRPVMVDEIASWLPVVERTGAILVDGTVGGGGHLVAMAKRLGEGGRAIGLDRDPSMLVEAKEAVRLSGFYDRVTLVHAAYGEMPAVLEQIGIEAVDAIILDLGLSSDQLAAQDRGFSFASEGPLDMRFDAGEDVPTAADLVNQLREAELADLFYELGEERFSRRIAAGWWKSGSRIKSGARPNSRRLCVARFRATHGTDRSIRRPASSRRFGSPSTTSSASSSKHSQRFRACSCRRAEPRSSAFIRWRTGASNGPSRNIRNSLS